MAIQLTKDIPTDPNAAAHPDPNKTGTSDADSPGGKDAPAQSAYEMSHSQEEYPGPSPGGETAKTGEGPDGVA